MIRIYRPVAAIAALSIATMAEPAAATPTMVMSNSQKIELVRDLPNDSVFEHDGNYYDLGYLYSTERVNGADVARSGSGFVLYHDDRFIRLDADKLAMVSDALGEDPTEGYVPPAGAGRDGGSYSSRSDDPTSSATSYPGDGGVPYRSSSSSSYSSYRRSHGNWLFSLIALPAIFGWRVLVRRAAREIAGKGGRSWSASESDGQFEQRLNARLAELNNAPAAAAPPAPAPAAPTGFGRKQV